MRFAIQDGKRSGARILYVDLVLAEEGILSQPMPKAIKRIYLNQIRLVFTN